MTSDQYVRNSTATSCISKHSYYYFSTTATADSHHRAGLSADSCIILVGLWWGIRALTVRGPAWRHRAKWKGSARPLMDDARCPFLLLSYSVIHCSSAESKRFCLLPYRTDRQVERCWKRVSTPLNQSITPNIYLRACVGRLHVSRTAARL